jgi:ribosomal protein L20A (L18A)
MNPRLASIVPASMSGAHKFSKNLEATSKFYALEGWYAASSTPKTHKY